MTKHNKSMDIEIMKETIIKSNAEEFMELLHVFTEIANGLQMDQQEIKDAVYSYVSGECCCSLDKDNRVLEALSMLREDLIEMRKKWRELFADLEEERDIWDHLDLNSGATFKAAIIEHTAHEP